MSKITLKRAREIRDGMADEIKKAIEDAHKLYEDGERDPEEYANRVLVYRQKNIATMKVDASQEDILSAIKDVKVDDDLIGCTLSIMGVTKAYGRVDYFEELSFIADYYEIRKFEEVDLKGVTKIAICEYLEIKRGPDFVDCGLLELYMKGDLSYTKFMSAVEANC